MKKLTNDLNKKQFKVPTLAHDQRLDLFLLSHTEQHSRSAIQRDIKAGRVDVDGRCITVAKHKVQADQRITWQPTEQPSETWQAFEMPIEVLYEDDHICVLNKPSGLTMHPGAGTGQTTLANGLLAYDPNRSTLTRAGIVHRLDKNTSGCCVTAKTDMAQLRLTANIRDRQVHREYVALVHGRVDLPHFVEASIGRHSKRRTAMAVVANGRYARTDFQPILHYPQHTLLHLRLMTGRTHQIRVHMAHINHPIVGDTCYGQHRQAGALYTNMAKRLLGEFPHQALHAARLSFNHPISDKPLTFKAPLEDNFQTLLSHMSEAIEHKCSDDLDWLWQYPTH